MTLSRLVTGATLAVAMTLPAVLAWFYFVALAGGEAGINPVQQLTYSLGKTVQFSLPILYFLLTDPRQLLPRRPRFDGLLLGTTFGVAVGGAMLALYFGWLRDEPVFSDVPRQVRTKLSEFGVTTPGAYLGLSAFIVLVHSLLEEYYWRWFVFGRLRTLEPFVPALLLSSLAFMAHHVIVIDHYFPGRLLTATVPFSLGVAVGGAAWAWLYERTQSIYATWISHVLIDAAIFAIGWNVMGF